MKAGKSDKIRLTWLEDPIPQSETMTALQYRQDFAVLMYRRSIQTSLDVPGQEALVEVIPNCVVDEPLLELWLASSLVLEDNIIIPTAS